MNAEITRLKKAKADLDAEVIRLRDANVNLVRQWNEDIENFKDQIRVLKKRLEQYGGQEIEGDGKSTMVYLKWGGNETFRCDCGNNVFTKAGSDMVVCDSCGTKYKGMIGLTNGNQKG